MVFDLIYLTRGKWFATVELDIKKMKDTKGLNQKIIWLILLSFLAILSIYSLILFSKARSLLTQGNQKSQHRFDKLQGHLVTGFPDYPIFPGASIIGSYKKIDGERIGFEATWETNVPQGTVADWYLEEFNKYKGWTIHELPENFDSPELVFLLEKNNQKSTLEIEREDDITEITVEFPLN